MFIVLGIGVCFACFGSSKFSVAFALAPHAGCGGLGVLDVLCLLLFLGAMGKSAQLGLHTWLPDAMEGPTPVSALIHAATMVTAGVFLVIRCSPLFDYSPKVLGIVTLVGALTAFAAATIALAQYDIKKVIAYSTCSQLGYMFFACGLSGYSISFFHLFNHAFFKALLFLSAGAVIHGVSDEQDFRRLGGVGRLMPVTYVCTLVGSLSLAGLPFLSGFYSKDLILETALGSYLIGGSFAFWVGCVTAFITAFYSFRLLYLGFLQAPGASPALVYRSLEPAQPTLVPLASLVFGSVLTGYTFSDLLIGQGSAALGGAILTSPASLHLVSGEFLPLLYKEVPALFSVLGLVASLSAYSLAGRFVSVLWLRSPFVTSLLSRRWYFDTLYNSLITQPTLGAGYRVFFRSLDKGLLERLGPTGLARLIRGLSGMVRQTQTGVVTDYLTYTLLAFTALSTVTGVW